MSIRLILRYGSRIRLFQRLAHVLSSRIIHLLSLVSVIVIFLMLSTPLQPPPLILIILLRHLLMPIPRASAPTRRILNETINDPVLKDVHDEWEDQHGESDLQRLAALRPPQGPVADPREPWAHLDDGVDAQLHEEEANEVDEGLLEPPERLGRAAVVAGAQGLGGIGEGGVGEERVEDAEEEDKNGYADGCLEEVKSACTHRWKVDMAELTSIAKLSK